MKFYFQVSVDNKVVAVYSEIQPALDKAEIHLQDAKTVIIAPVKMTVDEFLEVTDKLLES